MHVRGAQIQIVMMPAWRRSCSCHRMTMIMTMVMMMILSEGQHEGAGHVNYQAQRSDADRFVKVNG